MKNLFISFVNWIKNIFSSKKKENKVKSTSQLTIQKKPFEEQNVIHRNIYSSPIFFPKKNKIERVSKRKKKNKLIYFYKKVKKFIQIILKIEKPS